MKLRSHPLLWPLLALAIILAVNAVMSPGFFAIELRDGRLYGSLIDILNRAVPVLLVSLGMTLVIATGGVDLSVGAVMAIAGAVAACLISRAPNSPLSGIDVAGSLPLVVGISLGVACLAGLFHGVLVGRFGVQPIVATLILMVAGRGIAQLLTDGQIITFSDPAFAGLGTGALLGMPMPVLVFAAALVLVSLLVRRTAFGLFIEAVGASASAARLSGVNPARVKVAVYVLSGLMAGIAGLIVCSDIKAADANNAGLYLELDAILAVCVGGTAMAGGRFSLAGSVIGAILMQALTTTILTRGISPEITLIAKAMLIVAVCLLQSPEFRRSIGVRTA